MDWLGACGGGACFDCLRERAAARCVGEEVGAVARGAGNNISDEGAVALASALQGNTTLLTLDLRGM
jgi:hypothetical protein